MARSGYLLDDLLVGGGLELVGGQVAKGTVEAGAVVPGDVFHGRPAGGGAGGPGLLVEALALSGTRRTTRPGRCPSTDRCGRSTTVPRDRRRGWRRRRWCTGNHDRHGTRGRVRGHGRRRRWSTRR